MQPGRELRLAAELANPDAELRERLLRRVARILRVAEQMERELLHAWRVPLAERGQRTRVAVLCPCHQDRVGEPLVDRAAVSRELWIGRLPRKEGCTALTLVSVPLVPTDVVLPRLRGSFGREYHYATATTTTQQMLPAEAAHGAVALAEHQTAGPWAARAGLGRRARHRAFVLGRRSIRSSGRALARADAGRRERGRGRNRAAGDDQASERRLRGRPQGRRDPRRGVEPRRARDRRQRRLDAMA